MADFDLVLKCWGPVEADYTAHGGEVLTRSVWDQTDRTCDWLTNIWLDSLFQSPACLRSTRRLRSYSPNSLASLKAIWRETRPWRPTVPRCWRNWAICWGPKAITLTSSNRWPAPTPTTTRYPSTTSRWPDFHWHFASIASCRVDYMGCIWRWHWINENKLTSDFSLTLFSLPADLWNRD